MPVGSMVSHRSFCAGAVNQPGWVGTPEVIFNTDSTPMLDASGNPVRGSRFHRTVDGADTTNDVVVYEDANGFDVVTIQKGVRVAVDATAVGPRRSAAAMNAFAGTVLANAVAVVGQAKGT